MFFLFKNKNGRKEAIADFLRISLSKSKRLGDSKNIFLFRKIKWIIDFHNIEEHKKKGGR